MSEQLELLFLVLFVLAAAACIYLSITMSRRVQMGINRWRNEERQALETQLKQLADADARMQIERWKQEYEQKIRLDAVQRSLAVTRGKVNEHIVPYLQALILIPGTFVFLARRSTNCLQGTERFCRRNRDRVHRGQNRPIGLVGARKGSQRL